MLKQNKNYMCNYCENFYDGIDRCKYCHFEPEDYFVRDDWDILDLDLDYDWAHLQILYRLHAKDLPCLTTDLWGMDVGILVGCSVYTWKIAEVLGMHEEAIYNDLDKGFIILNLYQEKHIREQELWEEFIESSKLVGRNK